MHAWDRFVSPFFLSAIPPRSVSRDSLCVLSPFVPAGDLFVDLGFGSRIFSGKPMLSEENLPYLQAVKKVAALCEKHKVSSTQTSPDALFRLTFIIIYSSNIQVPLLIPAFPQDVEETRKLNPAVSPRFLSLPSLSTRRTPI